MPTTEEQLRLEEEVRRGNEAKALLENRMLLDAFDQIERFYMARWRKSRYADAESRSQAYDLLRAMDEFRALLTKIVETGSLATAQRALADERAKRSAAADD